jgi:osmotically inducible lipoprotein OsmB
MNFKEFSNYLGAGALCLALGACMSNASNIQIGTVTGAVVGALAGSAVTGNIAGAIAGLIVGGVAGHEIGKNTQ